MQEASEPAPALPPRTPLSRITPERISNVVRRIADAQPQVPQLEVAAFNSAM